jgi:hypothetical protein
LDTSIADEKIGRRKNRIVVADFFRAIFGIPLLNPHSALFAAGCTLSAAITTQLALGASLPIAVANAKSYLNETLRQSYSFHSPNGEVIHALNQGTDFEG